MSRTLIYFKICNIRIRQGQTSVVTNKLNFTKSSLCISLHFSQRELEGCWCGQGTATFLTELSALDSSTASFQLLCPETAREREAFCPTGWICRAKYAAATTYQKRLDTRIAWANSSCSAKILVSELPSSFISLGLGPLPGWHLHCWLMPSSDKPISHTPS